MYIGHPDERTLRLARSRRGLKRVSVFLEDKGINRAKAFVASRKRPCPWSAVVRAGLYMYLEVAEDAKKDNHKFRLKDGRVKLWLSD